ncbi:type IV secretory system conjugative DNA transfer family protein [Xanthomonas campestris pv. campestris]|nr:type IV secretory system conjugative DNA transfer family protein [Xanthomonas campestris pv. campestris]
MTVKSKSSGKSTYIKGVPLLLLYFGFASSVCTQWAASRMAYHPALGEAIVGHIYKPWAWLSWQYDFYRGASETFNYLYLGFLLAVGCGFLGYVVICSLMVRRITQHDDVHGTAHWATREEIERSGLLQAPTRLVGLKALRARLQGHPAVIPAPPSKGVYVGAWIDEAEKDKETLLYLRHNGPEHIAVIAPTRSGKGVSVVNPTMLSWPDSLIAIDLKGELYNGTSGWRHKHANNEVYNFVPGSPNNTCFINPLAEIRLGSPQEVGDAQNVATIIVDPSGRGIDRLGHFEKTAHAFLVGLILHTMYVVRARDGRMANLGDVSDEMSNPDRAPKELYDAMAQNTHLPNGMRHPAVANAGRTIANKPEEEGGSVLSTAQSFFAIYDDPIVRANVSKTSIRPMDLMNKDRPVTLYLGPRPEDKDRLKPLFRLVISQILRVLLRPDIQMVNGRDVMPHRHRMLMLLDELPSFGKLEILQENLAYMAGYGIKAMLVMQDLTQLRDEAAYGRNEQLISNCHVRVVFAPNRQETADEIGKMTGMTTVVKEHVSMSGKRFATVLQQTSVNLQEQARQLMTGDELMRLDGPVKDQDGRITRPGAVLIFVAGHAPIKGVQSLYFTNPQLLKRWALPLPAPAPAPQSDDDYPQLEREHAEFIVQ